MNTIKNKIDISPLVYVVIMIVVFLLSSCKSTKKIPASKYQRGTWNNLDIKSYQSSIDTSFNYLGEVTEVFKNMGSNYTKK